MSKAYISPSAVKRLRKAGQTTVNYMDWRLYKSPDFTPAYLEVQEDAGKKLEVTIVPVYPGRAVAMYSSRQDAPEVIRLISILEDKYEEKQEQENGIDAE